MSLCMYSHSAKWEISRLRLVLGMHVLSIALLVFLFIKNLVIPTELSVNLF